MERLRELPGVQSVGLVENVPLNEGTRLQRFHAEGTDADAGAQLNVTFAAGDYFQTMGVAVLSGRVFRDDDHVAGRNNAIISKSAAKLLWADENPLGRRFQPDESENWFNVIGVVDDVMQDDYRQLPQPLIYLSLVGPTAESWGISSPAYVLKTARAEFIAPEVRALVRQVAPEAPMYRIFTMEGLAARTMSDLSFTMLTLGIAAGLALVLGAVGLYGVLSYVVAQRTREIGIRMALGAQARQLRRMVVAQGGRVALIGVVIGIVGAVLATRVLDTLLFGVRPMDVVTFTAMSALMLAVALIASYIPARRASAVDPMRSLRTD
jgi:predicted permease